MDASPNNLTDNPLTHPPAGEVTDSLTAAQLKDIKAQLDLVLMAIEALTNIGSESVLEAAKALQVDKVLSDRVGLWRLRQSSPLRKGKGRKKLDVEEAKALVLVICHLSATHHGRIRQAVARLEQATQQGEPPHRAAILGDYLDNFSNFYSDRMSEEALPSAAETSDRAAPTTTQALVQLAFRLLIDLLFYSAPGGERQLWLALLDRAISQDSG